MARGSRGRPRPTAAAAAAALLLLLVACPTRPPCVHGLASVPGDYRTLMDIVTDIVEQDEYWAQAFDQPVYHRLDRSRYGRIVDEELLDGARGDRDTVVAGSVDASAPDRGDAIRPMRFLRNVMRRRYRIGSVLQMAVDVLHKSLTCVAYKHVVHLLKLIRVEISRTTSSRKALSWSGKAIAAVAGIVIKMAGLRLVDAQLLRAAAFLDAYGGGGDEHAAGGVRRDKFDLTPALDQLSSHMLEYIGRSCVRAPADELAVAKELHVLVTPNLYHAVKSKSIKPATYKEMFKSIMAKTSQLFDALPATAAGMSADRWDEILHFRRSADERDHYEFYRITRH